MKDRFARVTRWISLVATLVGVAAHAADARAQRAVIGPLANPGRNSAIRAPASLPYWISRQDCLNDDVLTFELTLSGPFTQYSLEVWAGGADCTPLDARMGPAPTCWLVGSAQPTQTPFQLPVRALDIVAHHTPDSTVPPNPQGIKPGSLADCTDLSTTPPQKIVLDFMLVTPASGMAELGHQMFATGYDIWSPSAPTDVEATPGDTRLHLTWTRSTSTDVVSYYFHCDPPPGGWVSDGGPVTDCSSNALTPGIVPYSLDPYLCGYADGAAATTGTVEKLSNDEMQLVSVVAVDTVRNVGVLSFPACATPHAGADPPPHERDDSLCSVSRVEPHTSWRAFAWIGIVLALAKGRRRFHEKFSAGFGHRHGHVS